MKQLYFLHIPKTAGKYISKNIKESLDKNNLGYFISTETPNDKIFMDRAYISMHAGTYPIETIEGINVATLIRNPVEARLSYFNFVYDRFLYNRKEYQEIESVYDKLKFYLFEDPNMECHNNFQSRFICNPADEKSFSVSGFYLKDGVEMMKPFYKDNKAFDWFVKDFNTSETKVFENLNKFDIVNTVDRIDLFERNISLWFNKNYGFDINFNRSQKVNESATNYGKDNLITTKDLLSMLTKSDKLKIIENNMLDQKAYEFVKLREF